MCHVGGPGDPLEKPSAGRLAAEPLRSVPACWGTAGGRGPRKGRGPALLCPTCRAALGSSLRLCEPLLASPAELGGAYGRVGDFRGFQAPAFKSLEQVEGTQ